MLALPAKAERVRIVVGGANFRPYPIAVPDVVILSESSPSVRKAADELQKSLRYGAEFARSLELVPVKTYLSESRGNWANPVFANWANVGASGLVRVGFEMRGENVKTTFRFFDVLAQRELLARTYNQKVTEIQTMAFTFLDELVEFLTGDRGVLNTRIAFVKRSNRGKAIFTSLVDGAFVIRVTDINVLSLLPNWDPTGRFILFTSYLQNNPDLYRVDLQTNKIEGLSDRRGLNTGAVVSPDGKFIAFTLSIDGNTEIYTMNWRGEQLTRLTDSWGQDVSPSFSPDGKRIAFVSSRSGAPHIYIMNNDGSNVRRLTFKGNYNQEPNWSPRPDGQIAFTARDERLKFDVFLVHPESGEITRLTQDDGHNESPSHSPDGHHVVFTTTRQGKLKHIYIMDVDGKHQKSMPLDAGDYESPKWGPRFTL